MVNKENNLRRQAVSIIRYSLFCVCASLLFSCGDTEEVVAKVDDKELTASESELLMEHMGYDPSDKEQYKEFLELWCEQEMFLAELKDTDQEYANLTELRSRLFAGDLARYYLEENRLKGKLDTVVTNEQILAYYDERKTEFELSDYLVRALYLKIPKSVDYNEDKVQELFLLKNDKDLSEINSYAKLYAENYYFSDSSWILFNELAKDIPASKYNVDNIVLNRSKTYFSDEEFTYFINILDFSLKDEAPPLEFLRDQIKEIIVMNRLQKLKEQNESKMIQDIKDKHEITINR